MFINLGDSDKTKCFYCNGGLQNWDYNDEPWTEHAKWFPGYDILLIWAICINMRAGNTLVLSKMSFTIVQQY